MAEWFAMTLLESIPHTLKEGHLKMDNIRFKECRQIWPQSHKKNSKFAYFLLLQIRKVQIFIQGREGKWLNGLHWYF